MVEYAGPDIDAMREIDKNLPTWNYSGHELALWYRDQRINDRGVFMDVQLAEAAVTAVEMEQSALCLLKIMTASCINGLRVRLHKLNAREITAAQQKSGSKPAAYHATVLTSSGVKTALTFV